MLLYTYSFYNYIGFDFLHLWSVKFLQVSTHIFSPPSRPPFNLIIYSKIFQEGNLFLKQNKKATSFGNLWKWPISVGSCLLHYMYNHSFAHEPPPHHLYIKRLGIKMDRFCIARMVFYRTFIIWFIYFQLLFINCIHLR